MVLFSILKDKWLVGKGLKSWCFHVTSPSIESKRLKSIKALLTHPGICYSVDEVSLKDASHVMEEDFRRMQHELHGVNDLEIGGYLQEVSEVMSRVSEEKNKVYRFKVLVDLRILDEKGAQDLIDGVGEIRNQMG